MKEALAECDAVPSDEGIPWSKIADKHGVVRSTLSRKHRGETRSRKEVSTSQRNLQPHEEAELVQYIDELTKQHLPPTREMVQNFASDIAGHRVSETWVSRFLHRHDDELTSQFTTSMDRQRHVADSGEKYRLYFDALRDKIEFYKIEPEHTYNMDEKGFMIGAVGRQKRIFTKRQFKKKAFKQMLQDGNREWVSLMACVCADGSALPPSLIYAAESQNIQSTWVEDVKVGEHMAFFGTSPSGWSNDGLGLAWLQQVFQRFTAPKARRKYRLLLVDGHGSHLTEEFLEYCHRHKIIVGVYPPHSTHTLQPLDVVMFKPLSTAYSKKLGERLFKHKGLVPVKKPDFFLLFWQAWAVSFTKKNILSSFKAVGVWPLNPDVVLNRFIDSDSETSSGSNSDAPTYEGDQWRLLDRVARHALSGATEKEASIIRQSLHHMAIQNTLLRSENDGLLDALTTKRKREKQGRPLALLQHYEYWGPYMMWTPRSFREARTRMSIAKREAEEEELAKEEARRSKAATTAYKKQIAAEKRAKAAREKEERDRKRAEERQAIEARKAERARKKQECDAQKASKSTQKGKRKASQQQGVKKKQKRGGAAAQSDVVACERSPTPPAKTTTRGRNIKVPQKYR